jgi:iron complex transport system substrate-binding protein
VLVASLSCILVGGCSSSATTAPTTIASTVQETSTTARLTTTSKVVAAATSTTIARPAPKVVVSLSPTATETLFALGAGAIVKAVDEQSTYPPSAPRQAGLVATTATADQMKALQTDLVIVSDSTVGDRLTAAGVVVVVQLPAKNLEDVYAQIKELGRTVGHETEAEKVVTGMRARITTIVAKGRPQTTPLRYYHERNEQFGSVSSNSFLGQLYGLLNLHSIADDVGQGERDFPTLSSDNIVRANPDVIFLADGACCHQTPDTMAARPGWSAIKAIKNNAVVTIDDDLASRWGPRIVDLLQAVANRLA